MNLSQKLFEKIRIAKEESFTNDAFLTGRLGMVYYNLVLYTYFKEESYLEAIQEYLMIIFENIENNESILLFRSTFEHGLSGLGYVLNLLMEEEVIDRQYKLQINEINKIVADEAISMIEKSNYDFLRGPFGILFYLNSVSENEAIDVILDVLLQKIDNKDNFLFYNNVDFIEGVHIGYAHGICAIISVLDQINSEKSNTIIKYLLDNFLNLLQTKRFLFKDKEYFLPRSVHKENVFKEIYNYQPVLAWSNCDLNFSTLIYSLNEKLVDEKLIEIANQIAIESTKRKEEKETRINDYHFFYGSAGVVKMYQFLFKKTDNQKFKEASSYWYEKTKEFLLKAKNENMDLLKGLPGVALVLLEFENQIDLKNDKLLFLK